MHKTGVVFLLWAGLVRCAPLVAQIHTPVEATQLGSLELAGIRESSGVAVSTYEGVLWTNNDSGDGPFLYAVEQNGRLLAKYRVIGARALDWEDLAVGPCPQKWTGRTCVFIADTGDNLEQRAEVTIYIVPEPDPREPGAMLRETDRAKAVRIRYASGPHDAEGLAINPTGDLTLVTKGRSGRILRYAIPRSDLQRDSLSIVPVDTVPIDPHPLIGRWVTSAAISPSGQRAVFGTHTELYFFDRTEEGWQRSGPACFLGTPLRQWEAVDFLDEEYVVVTSEQALGHEGVIYRIRCF
jgi:hypothetical protein